MRLQGAASRCVRAVSLTLYCWFWTISFILVTLGSTGAAQVAAHFSFAQSIVVSGLSFSYGVAVDSSGNVYIADASAHLVLKETFANGAYSNTVVADAGTNGADFAPFGVAVDAAGNIYVADSGNNIVVKIAWTGTAYGAQTTVANVATDGPYFSPAAVAVDASGNVYIADPGTNVVFKHAWNGTSYSAPVLIGNNWDGVQGVAVDAAGNIYYSDSDDSLVVRVPSSDPTCVTASDCISIGTGLLAPTRVAVDAEGNLYIADTGNSRVVKEPWTGTGYGTQTTLGTGLLTPYGVAAGDNGDIYISDSGNYQVLREQTFGVNFNSVPLRATGPAQTLTFTFDVAGNLKSSTPYQILAQGSLGGDFGDALTGDTCNGTTSYAPGDTCTVTAHFVPTLANTRLGAISLYDTSGTPIATAYLYGIGHAPQIIFTPATQSAAAQNGLSNPVGAAVDTAGNLYIADSSDNAVRKYAPNGSGGYALLSDVAANLNAPSGVAVDGAGIVYVADTHNNAVHRYAPNTSGGYTQIGDVATGLNLPSGVTVDSSGNVYIADSGNNAVHKYTPNNSGGYSQLSDVAQSALDSPFGVAVDSSGNVFVADTGNNAVHEYAPDTNGGYMRLSDPASGTFDRPHGVAVDSRGNVYIADSGNSSVQKFAPGSAGYTQLSDIGSGFNFPEAVAMDASGNVYVADSGNARVLKEDFSDGPSLTFPTSTAVNAQDTADGPKTITVSNYGNVALSFSALGSGNNPSYPANFPENASDSNLCASGTSVAPGSHCDISTYFRPSGAGTNSGVITLTDNNLDSSPSTQTISLAGTGVATLPTLNVIANNATRVYGTANPALTGGVTGALNGDTFTESFTTTATLTSSVGSYPIVPSVSGPDLSNYSMNITPGSLSITQAATSTTFTASAARINPGQSVTLAAQVISATTGTPTGTVNFYDGSTLLGAAALNGGSATYSTNALTAGTTNSLTASYQGDTNFTGSTSTSAVAIPVAALDFSLSVAGAQAQTVAAGNVASYSLQISPTYGTYPGNVTFSASGLPAGASLIFSPTTVPSNGGAQTVAASVQTTSTDAKNVNPLKRGYLPLALSFLLLPFAGIRTRRNRSLVRGLFLTLLIAAGTIGVGSLSACGSQSGSGSQQTNLQSQSYAITVTGTSGSTQHSVDLTLTVD